MIEENDRESAGTADYLRRFATNQSIYTVVGDVSTFEMDYDASYSEVRPRIGDSRVDLILKMYPYEWIA